MAKAHQKRKPGRPVNTVPHVKVMFSLQPHTLERLRESARKNSRTLSAQADLVIQKGLV